MRFRVLTSLLLCGWLSTYQTAEAAQQNPTGDPRRPSTGDSDVGTASIDGRVTLPSGGVLSGAVKIRLSTANDPGIELYTDSDGRFSFRRLRAGNYAVEAGADSDQFEVSREEVRLMRGMRTSLTINLREKKSETTRRATPVISVNEMDNDAPEPARKEFQKATQLASEGKSLAAIESYKRTLELFPRFMMAHNDLGVQYLNLKRLDEAKIEFESAIEINPKAFNPRLNLGIVLVNEKQYTDALEQLRLAMSINSAAPSVHLYTGIAMVETDQLETAERELSIALSMGGAEFSIAHYYMGLLRLRTGDGAAAQKELESYLKHQPSGDVAKQASDLLAKLDELSKNGKN